MPWDICILCDVYNIYILYTYCVQYIYIAMIDLIKSKTTNS